MVTGAFFEPKALCGSMSGRLTGDCGTGGREAALASTTGAGSAEGSDSVRELTGADGDCASDGAEGAGSGVLCKEGRNKAIKPSKPTLRIPARIRRRFTRSSKMIQAICPDGRQKRILPRNCGKGRGAFLPKFSCRLRLRSRFSKTRLFPDWLRSRPAALCLREF